MEVSSLDGTTGGCGVCVLYSFINHVFVLCLPRRPVGRRHSNERHGKRIIHNRGEGTEGYSDTLRQLEFESAFRAEMADYFLLGSTDDKFGFDYADALSFPSGASMSLGDEVAFEMTPASTPPPRRNIR